MPERYFTKAAVVVAHQIFLFFYLLLYYSDILLFKALFVATPTSACWCCFMKTIKRRTAHSTGLPKTSIEAKRRI